MSQKLSEEQIERWRIRAEERQQDNDEIQLQEKIDQRRVQVQAEMLLFLEQFLSGAISVEQFKSTYDKKTRTDWDVFGFKGMSGAMFLNTLIKHIPDQVEVTQKLKKALLVPKEVHLGQAQMQDFFDFLNGLYKKKIITKRQVQASRVPFFVSSWWHLQDNITWPIYYISNRRMLEQDGIYQASKNPITNYFIFRKSFLALANKLNLSAWELEHLLGWYNDTDKVRIATTSSNDQVVVLSTTDKSSLQSDQANDADDESNDELLGHSHIQWLLARIGRKLGCKIWIASNDHKRSWRGQTLGSLSEKALPNLGVDRETERIISLIDVIWLQGRRVVAAFEVEKSTSIFSGLLRMSDLVAMAPNLNIPLYIVTPERRLDKVRRELSRPTFQTLELHEQCGYFSFEALAGQADNMMMWATDPTAIDRLAQKVKTAS